MHKGGGAYFMSRRITGVIACFLHICALKAHFRLSSRSCSSQTGHTACGHLPLPNNEPLLPAACFSGSFMVKSRSVVNTLTAAYMVAPKNTSW